MDVRGLIAIALAYLAILIFVDTFILQPDSPHQGCTIETIERGGICR